MSLGTLTVAVSAEDAGERLDRFLTARLPGWSRARVQAAIREGHVRPQVGEQRGEPVVRPSLAVAAGTAFEVTAPEAPKLELTPAAIPLRVLYEDEDLAAIDKPAGLVVHPGAGRRENTLVHALLHRFAELSSGGDASRPGIVHRLDRLSSGVIVVARNDWTHQRLAAQFQARTVEKSYRALVHGRLPAARGESQAPIHRDRFHRLRMTTRRRDGREAHTRYQAIERFEAPAATPAALRAACRYTLAEVEILTGRTHQIRVHMAALGHPVVGDRLYGAPARLAGPGALAGFAPSRVYLHAADLRLDHPRTGRRLEFHAPLPKEFEEILSLLRGI